jgi:HEAT repeat protein
LISQLGQKSFQDLLIQNIFQNLALFKEPSAFALGETYFQEPYSSRIRNRAMNLMAVVGNSFTDMYSEPTRVHIEKNLADTDFSVRMAAISSLKSLGNKNAIEALKQVSEVDVDGRIRAEAASVAMVLEKGTEVLMLNRD